jgi:hypothetical protein
MDHNFASHTNAGEKDQETLNTAGIPEILFKEKETACLR